MGPEFQATTAQAAGLFPFVAGSGSPSTGVPIGRHMMWGEVVCLDSFAWLEAGLVTNPGMFILGQPGVGKALRCTEMVPTPAGWTTMGAIRAGDYVFDEHGQPTRVAAVSEVLRDRECLEVEFSDGSKITADADHLWVTETVGERMNTVAPRYMPRQRRSFASHDDRRAILSALVDTDDGARTTIVDLGRELGWYPEGPWQRLYRWAREAPPPAGSGYGRLYDRMARLQVAERHVEGEWNDQRWRTPHYAPITTRDMAATLMSGNGKRNHRVRVAGALQLAPADLPIPPRVLGLWLGDGTPAAASYCTADPELLEDLVAAGYRCRPLGQFTYSLTIPACRWCGRDSEWKSRRGCRGCGRPSSFRAELRGAGLLGAKHIPGLYLRASEDQRRALLSGLLDTDGSVSASGAVEYTSTCRQLAVDVHELVCSLGYRGLLRETRAKLNGRDMGPKWTIRFTTAEEVFGLPRKRAVHAARSRSTVERAAYRYVVDVRPVPSVPVRCIQVAAASGQFLVGEAMIPTHNSALIKRLMRGMAGFGIRPIVLGDLKPDYTSVVARLGGQVIRVGRGMDRINPLDTGPLGQAAARLSGTAAEQLRAESRGRRLNALMALLALVRRSPVTNGEECVLGAVIDLLDEHSAASGTTQPTVPDVLSLLRSGEGLHALMPAADVDSPAEFREDTKALRQTLNLLCTGSLKGVFDGPTTQPLDLDGPAVTVDISRVSAAGDTLVAAAMLSTWAYGFAMIDGASALADQGLAPRRQFCIVMDELWRALRGSPGLVEHADALTRVNRAKGVCDIRATHSLADLEALPTEEDRAKARGFVERAGVTVLAALSPLELTKVAEVVPLSPQERSLVSGWSAPASWVAGEDHPGKGKYLIKAGSRGGIPVQMAYVGDERELYNTDAKMARDRAEVLPA